MNHEEELKRLLADFTEDSGFRDQYGYIVHQKKENKDAVMKPDGKGEATLYTAIAVIAVATGNYKQDDWDKNSANKSLEELLTTLLKKSWGNKDNLGRYHPIRHPEDIDYYKYRNDVKSRMSPLTKDSFGAIVAGSYYSYACPNSSQEVRKLARDLMTKWTEYLILFQWRTHSIYIENEFEYVKDADKKIKYKYIYSDNTLKNRKSYKGTGSFMLLPHEIYALQNVAAHLGIATSQWNAWENMTPELKQTFIDFAAPYIAQYAGEALDNLLQSYKGAFPYSIPLGPPDWSLGKINGVFTFEIPSSIRDQIVTSFKEAIKDLLREIVRLDNYNDYQGDELLGILINRVLDLFPDVLGRDSWRTILTKSIQQVLPWITKSGWLEALTFIGSLQLLKTQSISSISYTLWIYAVECEARPEMKDLLKTEEFFSYLRGNENPNSLWAWIAEDSGRVSEHLQLFESKDWNYWWRFAYQEDKFNDWLKKPEDQSNEIINQNECNNSPRLDYLVLSGLAEKGAPVGLTDTLSDWWGDFMKLAGDAANQFINNLTAEIQRQFSQAGYYIQEKINEVGELIRETWSNTLEYTNEKFFQGNLIEKSTWNPVGILIHKWAKIDGKVIEEFWSETGDLLERITNHIDGSIIEEYWKQNGEIERIIFPIDGTLIHEYWNREGEKYWKGVWSNVDGAAENMIERLIHPIDGTLIHEYWNREGEKYWKGVWSNVEGAAKDMIERLTERSDGTIEKEAWDGAGKWGRTVWNTAGEVIERVGDLLPDLHWPPW
ncbi:hypothetical protein [Lysinibacillus irui]|uniref:Uncharacterized protein n=1 Tax=Lysinibacillus irui TaxID=2998077 RepID=A0AAJ5UTM8_9BACI|nr:hypothetical protein [Lysinibacillus irui]WDV09206.1 hypothetical protein OU989_23245 [Lysinibacillus irui]